MKRVLLFSEDRSLLENVQRHLRKIPMQSSIRLDANHTANLLIDASLFNQAVQLLGSVCDSVLSLPQEIKLQLHTLSLVSGF